MIRLKLLSLSSFTEAKNIFEAPNNAEFWCRVESKLELAYLLITCMQYTLQNLEYELSHNTSNMLILNTDNNFYIEINENTYDSKIRVLSISSPFVLKRELNCFTYICENTKLMIDIDLCVDIKMLIKEIALYEETQQLDILLIESIISGYINDNCHESYSESISKYEKLSQIIYFLLKTELLFTRIDNEEKPSDTHPKVHIDFTTEKHSQFKIGLPENINAKSYIEICDLSTQCRYLNIR